MERMKELSLFSGSFDLNQMNTVHQWIKKFEWNKEDEDRIKILLDAIHERKRGVAEALADERVPEGSRKLKTRELKKQMKKIVPGRIEMEIRQNEAKLPVIGFCPRCGSTLGGQPCGGCSKKKFERVFVKICGTCTYYSEIFKKRNKYFEVEGG